MVNVCQRKKKVCIQRNSQLKWICEQTLRRWKEQNYLINHEIRKIRHMKWAKRSSTLGAHRNLQQWCVLLSFKNFFPLTTTSNQTSFWLFLWRSWTRWFFPVFPGVEMSWAIDARELPLWVERCRDDWELLGDPDPSTSFLLLLGGERSDSGFGEGE